MHGHRRIRVRARLRAFVETNPVRRANGFVVQNGHARLEMQPLLGWFVVMDRCSDRSVLVSCGATDVWSY